jgi:threonine dehydrogenase-like Zn-dependent dehydrogenase
VRAARFAGVEKIELVDVSEPELGAGDILVRVAACGICGTDLHTYKRGAHVEVGQIMGHEFAGVVSAVGRDVDRRLAVGDRVTALPLVRCGTCDECLVGDDYLCQGATELAFGLPGAFAERIRVPRATLGVNVFHLPDQMSFEAAALAEPLAVAVHAIHDLAPPPDAEVVVLGLGTVGLGMVAMLRLVGARHIVAVDPSELRQRVARALGATVAIAPADAAELRRVLGSLPNRQRRPEYDAAIDCSGRPEPVESALEIVRPGGVVVAAAQYPGGLQIDGPALTNREATVRGSYAYRAAEFGQALTLLADKRIDAEQFISATFGLEDIDRAFHAQMDVERSVKVLVTPNAALLEAARAGDAAEVGGR